MNNQAQKWLNKWVESGGYWYLNSDSGASYLLLYDERSYSNEIAGFRQDMRQLLKDAEAGRKMREAQE